MKNFYETFLSAVTEEELKHLFAKFFKIKLSTKNYIDLYTPQILFEFKYDAVLKNVQTRATCIAQTLYYIRRLKFGSEVRTPSRAICVVTKNSAIFFDTKNFSSFYKRAKYDWDLAPSSPCKKLVSDLANSEIIREAHVYDFSNAEDEQTFVELIRRSLIEQLTLFEKKEINEQNFYPIFQLWEKIFGTAVENGRKSSEYFITDIEEGKSQILGNSVLFRMSSGELVEKFLDINEYKHFWSVYEKVTNPRAVISIRQKMDRMSEINLRRFTGEFFTPIDFAKKAVDYLMRTVHFDENYRIWDMAAGTGNLEFALPVQALKYCYISTLLPDDADYCKRIFPEATVFQYDYLNDDVEFLSQPLLEKMGARRKMPQKLADDLKNPDLKWIIFINPPYVTAANPRHDKKIFKKDKVSMTAVRNLMGKDKLKASSQELSVQFLYRISREFKDRQAYLGIFSKLTYIKSEYDKKFREKAFRYKFERGFMFSSKNFEGCTGKFPVGFLIWNLSEPKFLHEQEISLDVYDELVEKIAVKRFLVARGEKYLNNWAIRSRGVKKYPPMSSGIRIAQGSKTPKDKVPEDFLATFMYSGNDFSNQTYTAFVSGAVARHGGISVTPENFEQCMIVHMARRLPKATWLNDRDQFLQPTKSLPAEFISDAVVWSLFAPSNQTVSLRNVEYDGEIYQMRNNFYPFTLEEVKNWKCSSPEIKLQLEMAREDRFAAVWLKNNRLSSEAALILDSARELYQKFYAELADLDIRRWKIENWDVGWYQIRMSLDVSLNLEPLSEKLLPQIYDLGFLRDEVRYF